MVHASALPRRWEAEASQAGFISDRIASAEDDEASLSEVRLVLERTHPQSQESLMKNSVAVIAVLLQEKKS